MDQATEKFGGSESYRTFFLMDIVPNSEPSHVSTIENPHQWGHVKRVKFSVRAITRN